MNTNWKAGLALSASMFAALSMHAVAEEAADIAAEEERTLDTIVIVGQGKTYTSLETNESMQLQQAPITSALAVIDNLPGVNVSEGDVFGFDDWSTSISLRGFQTNLSEQQVGITIDGLPNGGSNYGGGAKANRYIDSQNMGAVEVSQGTADIASRSNEALGGTLNFTTSNPLDEENVRLSASIGDYEAQRIYGRYDTGLFLNDTTKAWISFSRQTATDWMEGSAESERTHFAAKAQSFQGPLELTGYVSYDDTHEDNYQRVYSKADFENYPDWDQLTGDWTGIPYVDQAYRRGWSTLRDNLFMYLKADYDVNEDITVSGSVYHHANQGRGDWVPPYIVNIRNDAGAESEIGGGPAQQGGAFLGQIFFVDGNGFALTADPGCVSSLTFPYGGGGAQYDPACYADGAIGVQSYRHTHYQKKRTGLTLDGEWEAMFGNVENTLRGGIWYEDTQRDEYRDWHKITDTRIGHNFEKVPYWVQYNREYPQTTFKWYIEDSVTFGPVTATLGLKQFNNEVERNDLFDATAAASIDSDSDVLLSGGVTYNVMEGLELFAGYAENYKALGDLILERPASSLGNIEPETAEVIEVGARYTNGLFTGSLTFFDTEFANRLIFVSADTATGPNYLIGTDGSYVNAGGIESQGVEVAGTLTVNDNLELFASYTYNDSTYLGTGDAAVDAASGIVPGNKVTGVPENMFVVSADWTRNNFFGGISFKYVDDREVYAFAQGANGFVLDSYTIGDLYAGVSGEAISDSLSGFDIRVNINNLFDEQYLGTHDFNSGAWLGAARTTVLTVTADF